MDVSRETLDVTTKPHRYDLANTQVQYVLREFFHRDTGVDAGAVTLLGRIAREARHCRQEGLVAGGEAGMQGGAGRR